MKKKFLLFGLALPLLAQQAFDFRTLDRLDALTDHKTKITLDPDMLQLAARFLGGDGDKDAASLKSMVGNLKGCMSALMNSIKTGSTPRRISNLSALI
jgi:hypothetical protein